MKGSIRIIMAERKKSFQFQSDEIAAFCDQIAILLNSGIPIYEGTFIMSEEVEHGETKRILTQIDAQVKENKPLFQVLEDTKAFPAYMVSMVRVGEVTGKLEDVMILLARYYEREGRIKSNIRTVISYPLMLFCMMAVVLAVLVSKVLPMFQKVFDELNVDAAKTSGDFMTAGMTAGKVVAAIMAVIFVIAAVLILWYGTKTGKEKLNAFAGSFILTRGISQKLATGQFISSMSLMISSGIETVEGLELAREVVKNPAVSKKIDQCLTYVDQNDTLAEALNKCGLLKGIQGRMVLVGSRTGSMDAVFQKLSNQYDEEIEENLSRVSSGIETGLVITLSCVVGAILISVMMPLVSIISSIG